MEQKIENALPDGMGYARLKGFDFDFLVKATEITLGRAKKVKNEGEFIGLGNYSTISKTHVKIYWVAEFQKFELKNIGKNDVIVNKKVIKTDATIFLDSKMPIKVGPVRFYFLLPL